MISPCGSVLDSYMEKFPNWDFQKHWLNRPPMKATGKNTHESSVGREEDSDKDSKTLLLPHVDMN